MRVQLCCLCLGLVLALTGCGSGFLGLSEPSDSYVRAGYDFSQVDLVAVIDVVGDIESEAIKNQIAEYFTAQLLRKGYAPIERQRIQAILGQTDVNLDHIHPELYAVEAGQALEMPVVMLISVPSLGDDISITAKMIDVETGTALWLGRAAKSYRRGRSKKDSSDDWFGDDFTASLYSYNNVGLGDKPAPGMSKAMYATMSLQEEERVSDLVETLCKTLPAKAGRGGLTGALLGLIDSRPARTAPAPAPRVRADQGEPETSTPEVEKLAVQDAPTAPVPDAPSPPVQEPQPRIVQMPSRMPVAETPPAAPLPPALREPIQLPPRVAEEELRVISPGTAAPVQPSRTTSRLAEPKSIFEQGFADEMAKQPVYITDQSTPNMTAPLPAPRAIPQPIPRRQPESVYQAPPVETKTVWRQPAPVQPEPMPETVYLPDGSIATRWRQPGVPEARPKRKKSFWRNLLGLD